jgi:hypothetical protein
VRALNKVDLPTFGKPTIPIFIQKNSCYYALKVCSDGLLLSLTSTIPIGSRNIIDSLSENKGECITTKSISVHHLSLKNATIVVFLHNHLVNLLLPRFNLN